MDTIEIIEYAAEGMKWIAIGGGAYIGAIMGSNILTCTLFHKKLNHKMN